MEPTFDLEALSYTSIRWFSLVKYLLHKCTFPFLVITCTFVAHMINVCHSCMNIHYYYMLR